MKKSKILSSILDLFFEFLFARYSFLWALTVHIKIMACQYSGLPWNNQKCSVYADLVSDEVYDVRLRRF